MLPGPAPSFSVAAARLPRARRSLFGALLLPLLLPLLTLMSVNTSGATALAASDFCDNKLQSSKTFRNDDNKAETLKFGVIYALIQQRVWCLFPTQESVVFVPHAITTFLTAICA